MTDWEPCECSCGCGNYGTEDGECIDCYQGDHADERDDDQRQNDWENTGMGEP